MGRRRSAQVLEMFVYGLPIAEKTYRFRVPYYGFYMQVLERVGLFGYRWGLYYGFRRP